MRIYVEIPIRGSLDELWEKTQNPALHQRWDLRFSEISYAPRCDGEPQRFTYATRIGGGLRIDGAGESAGTRDGDLGERTSALKFWSDDPKSLIKEGSGYWKYIPSGEGITFLTWYDYETRFGTVGRAVDRMLFRPLLGWATAWSFDRLRLWIEEGVAPESSCGQAAVYSIARLCVALVWLYHGIIPKLIFRNLDETKMLAEAGLPAALQSPVVTAAGLTEIGLGLWLIAFWRARVPLWLTLILMALATVGVTWNSPEYLTHAFNPVTLNAAMIALSAIALISGTNLPWARNCRRSPAREAR